MAPGIDNESDGIEEALESTVRLAVMAGARLGSQIARAREDQLREQRRIDEREAGRLAQRFEAEKRAAVAELNQVHRSDWWERAHLDGGAERIGQTYATARAWAPEVEEAAQAERTMRDELHDRYGIDLDRTDPRAVASRIEAEVEAWRQRLAQQRRHEAERERSAETAERAEAALLLDQAGREEARSAVDWDEERPISARVEKLMEDPWRNVLPETNRAAEERLEAAARKDRERGDGQAHGRSQEHEGERLYDSADRRAAEVQALEAQGVDPEIAQSRMHADAAAGKPATLATRGARRGQAPKARTAVGRGAQAERTGVER